MSRNVYFGRYMPIVVLTASLGHASTTPSLDFTPEQECARRMKAADDYQRIRPWGPWTFAFAGGVYSGAWFSSEANRYWKPSWGSTAQSYRVGTFVCTAILCGAAGYVLGDWIYPTGDSLRAAADAACGRIPTEVSAAQRLYLDCSQRRASHIRWWTYGAGAVGGITGSVLLTMNLHGEERLAALLLGPLGGLAGAALGGWMGQVYAERSTPHCEDPAEHKTP